MAAHGNCLARYVIGAVAFEQNVRTLNLYSGFRLEKVRLRSVNVDGMWVLAETKALVTLQSG